MQKLTCSAIFFFTLFSVTSYCQTYKYATIDFPNATATSANGINNVGSIVGTYSKTQNQLAGIPPAPGDHGFKLTNGALSTINISNTISTDVIGINNNGDIVGIYVTSDNRSHGFWRHSGTIHNLSFGARAINNTPTIVGFTFSGSKCAIWTNGILRTLAVSSNSGDSTSCTGISNSGEIVGQNFTLDNFRSFLKLGSDIDFFEPAGAEDDYVNGVNGRGDVVGWSPSRGGGYLILNPEAGESSTDSEPKSVRISISFPGAVETVPMAINYSRVIVGSYLDSSAKQHGFLAIPQ